MSDALYALSVAKLTSFKSYWQPYFN